MIMTKTEQAALNAVERINEHVPDDDARLEFIYTGNTWAVARPEACLVDSEYRDSELDVVDEIEAAVDQEIVCLKRLRDAVRRAKAAPTT